MRSSPTIPINLNEVVALHTQDQAAADRSTSDLFECVRELDSGITQYVATTPSEPAIDPEVLPDSAPEIDPDLDPLDPDIDPGIDPDGAPPDPDPALV